MVDLTDIDDGADGGGNIELFGTLSAGGLTAATLFSKTQDQYLTVGEGESYPSSGQISEAVIKVAPRAGGELIDLSPILGLGLFL